MTKEQFTAIGLTEEQATKAAEASAEELKSYIPKSRFDEVNTAKKQAEEDVKERDKQLEELKKSSGNVDELKQQIETLQQENKAALEKAESEMKELKLNNAIKIALTGKVLDEDIVAGLVDRTQILLKEDGSVTGLEEQLKNLKENKAFLFKEEKQQQAASTGFQKLGGEPAADNQTESFSLKDALTAIYQK